MFVEIDSCQVEVFADAIPVSLLEDFWTFLENLVLSEAMMLDENYYHILGGIITDKTRSF